MQWCRTLILTTGSALLAAAAPDGELTINSGDLTVLLTAEAGWTIRSIHHKGTPVTIPAGGQGAVISPAEGGWLGSAMNKEKPEPVTSFAVSADSQTVNVETTRTVNAEHVSISKASELGALVHEAETTVEQNRIIQRHRFTAARDTSLKTFYAFIYSFVPTATNWLARTLDGELTRGAFAGEGKNVPGQPCEWLSQFDPKTGAGALVYFQTAIAGPGAFTRFWDTKSYHKLLAQPVAGALKKDTIIDLTMIMEFFTATEQNWEAQAEKMADNLRSEFPPTAANLPKAERIYDEGVPEAGMITLRTGDYTVSFDAARAWTIYNMTFGDKLFGLNNGFYGTVMTPKGGRWWGTGHTEGGKEVVHALNLTVDGREHSIEGGETLEGDEITFVKDSTIWKLKAHVEVRLSADHVFERTRLEALEDTELSLMYYFMHCYPPTTTHWLAELPDGQLTDGELTCSEKMEVSQDTRWVAQFEPEMPLGILSYTPKVIRGPKSASLIWDKKHYHKYYLRQNNGLSLQKGDVLEFSVVVKAVAEETGDWAATKAAADALKEQYPPVD